MAERKRGKDEKQILNSDQGAQGSIFKTAIVSAPIAIGGGMGISRLSKKSSHFGRSTSSLPYNPAADVIREFSNRYVSKNHAGIFKDWQLDKLSGFSQNTAIPHEVIYSSWMRAAKAADPTGMIETMSNKRLVKADTPHSLLNNIRQMVSTADSVYMRRTASSFLRDLDILQSRASQGLGLTPKSISGSIKTKIQPLSLGELDPKLRKDISRMGELFDTKKINVERITRSGLEGSTLRIHIPTRKFGLDRSGFELRIAESLPSNKGVVVSPGGSKYITGTYGLVSQGSLLESFNNEQFQARRAVEELIPRLANERLIDQRIAKGIISDFEKSMVEPAEFVPTVSEEMHSGVSKYISGRSDIMRLYSPLKPGMAPSAISDIEMHQIMTRGGLTTQTGDLLPVFPGYSPSMISKGVVSVRDVRDVFNLVPEAATYGRRPLQPLRLMSSPTETALRSMQANPVEREFGWLRASKAVESPLLKTAFVSSKLDEKIGPLGVHSEGQLLMSRSASARRSVKRYRQFNLAADQLYDISHLLEDSTSGYWKINKTLQKGALLGRSLEGDLVSLPKDMRLLEARLTPIRGKIPGILRVVAEEEVSEMKWSKVFGAAKGMAKEVEDDYINLVMRKHISPSDIGAGLFNEVEAIVTMDELKKNRALHYNQMFSSLWAYTKANMESGHNVSGLASNFANDPLKVIGRLRRAALKGDRFNDRFMLSGLTRIARKGGLTASQMGAVFGAVPDVFGSDYAQAMGKLSVAETTAIEQGVARGVGQFFFEDIGGPGSGKMATIEPRQIELLAAQHYGEFGPAIKADIIQRMTSAYPERIIEESALRESLQSLSDLKAQSGARGVSSVLGDLSKDALLPQEAGYVQIGELGSIYVPGEGTLKQLAGYKSPSGDIVAPDLMGKFRETLEKGREFEAGRIDRLRMTEQLGVLQSEVGRARSLAITGYGGLFRGRLPGSEFLTGVTGTDIEPGTVGVTRPTAKRMIDEMAQLNMYQATELMEMHSRLERGETISALIGRHPFIGQYSTQAAKIKLIEGTSPIAMFNPQWMRASIRGASGNLEKISNPITLSPLAGMAGDVDADIYSVSLVSPKLEKTLTSYTSDQNALDLYEKFSIRRQLLKAKASPGQVTLRQAMAGDAVKLGITEGGRLGKVSSALQAGKSAVLSRVSKLSTQEETNALQLLEWLEQTPISGKQISPGEELKMVGLLEDIQLAMQKKDANAIAETTKNILSNASAESRALLTNDIPITLEDVSTNISRDLNIPSLDIHKTAQNIVDTIGAYESVGTEGVSVKRGRQLLLGKVLPRGHESKALLSQEFLDLSPFGSMFTGVNADRGIFSRASSRVLGRINQLGALGKSMIPLAKPLALGTGAAVALANVFSEPPLSLSSEQRSLVMPNTEGGTGGAHIGTQINPDHAVNSEPEARTLSSYDNSAMVRGSSPMHYGTKVRVRANSLGNTDYEGLSQQLTGSIGESAQVRSFVRDKRSSLTSHKVNDILSNS